MNEVRPHTPKVVFVGTFPPTDEGIATFNEDMLDSIQKLLGRETLCQVAAINLRDTSPYYFDDAVRWEIDQDSLDTYLNCADDINSDPDIKCVVLQHEYGLFGGNWGEFIVGFLEKLNKPVLTVMHSVLKKGPYNPTKFRQVTNKVVENTDTIVVLSKKSKEILTSLYPKKGESIFYIPHGIHPVPFIFPEKVKTELNLSQKIVLTTFGLLSKDKGIEYVLKALPAVVKKFPNVLYQILGQTHPIIRRLEGEKYRNSLVALTKELGIRKNVRFVDKYMSLPELLEYLQATDLYIATSVNPNQAVSGTFSYAVGTGRAVVSTEFIQSKEVVTKKIGRLVPTKNPKKYAEAITELLSDKKALKRSYRLAYTKTRSMLWTNVAKNYIHLLYEITDSPHKHFVLPSINLGYLKKMTTKNGILQFAKYDIPSKEHGYTVDDNARALIATSWLSSHADLWFEAKKLNQIYFSFLKKAFTRDGNFTNYLDINLKATNQNKEEEPEEHIGRCLWALAETMSNSEITTSTLSAAKKMWNETIKKAENINYIRPKAYVLKALFHLHKNTTSNSHYVELTNKLAENLVSSYHENARKNWHWFEDNLSYNNALLPESLALAYKITKNREYLKIAKKTMAFLLKKTFMGEVYVPIGQNGWYKRGKKRSFYDQQPEDVCATILALITMFEVTKRVKYLNLAKHAFTWFLGNNLSGIPLYNFKTGGVYDGLEETGVNKNQGAESLVSYLLARIRIEKYI